MLHPSMNPSFMPIIITHTLTFLIGVIGNGVVIATWSMHGKFRSPTAVFLVSLAIADLLLLLVFVPLETLEYFMITWTGLSSICKMIAYVEAISAMSTVMNLLAVSIERFLVIVYPMRARSWCTMSSTRKGLIIIWSFAFVLSTPVLLTRHTSQITYYNMTTSLTLYYCFDVENDLTFIVAIYQLLVMFILPALFMVVCYYVVIRQLWSSTRSVNMMTQAENKARQVIVSRKNDASSTLFYQNKSTNRNNNNNNNSQFYDNEKSFSTDFTQILSNYQQKQSCHQNINEMNESNLSRISSQQPNRINDEQKNNSNGDIYKQNNIKTLATSQWQQNSKINIDNGEVGKNIEKHDIHNDDDNENYSMTSFIDCLPKISESSMGNPGNNENMLKQKHHHNHVVSGLLKNNDDMDNDDQKQQSIDDDKNHNDDHSDTLQSIKNNSHDQINDNSMRSNNKNNNSIQTNHRTSSSSLCYKSCSRTLSSNVMEITKSRIQVIKMLVLIIILFLLCWGPRLIMNVLVKSGLSTFSSWIYNTRVMCNLLSFIHSALNPFVYGFMSSNFRSMVCSSFGRRKRNKMGKNNQFHSHFENNNNNNRRM
ncbi:g protein-coupled receptor-like protein 3 [Dermatophagoides farinae]|uniref:G protein-coupled receptor-like protein 3 n=1 Tax=Dermatophagoides farinae TaxID=6954 RepID=A0A9D4SKS5_DERFA|nr:g protein-coupled receptor-like protein 3 [Dermatophagoides farinae]